MITEIERNINDCIYYALAKLLEGRMITADLKFPRKLQEDPLASCTLDIKDIFKLL